MDTLTVGLLSAATIIAAASAAWANIAVARTMRRVRELEARVDGVSHALRSVAEINSSQSAVNKALSQQVGASMSVAKSAYAVATAAHPAD